MLSSAVNIVNAKALKQYTKIISLHQIYKNFVLNYDLTIFVMESVHTGKQLNL
jgi:hypothetical protein